MVQLVTANQFQLAPDLSNIGNSIQQGLNIRGQFDQRKAQARQAEQEQSFVRAKALDKGITALAGVPMEQRQAVFEQMSGELAKANIDSSVLADLDFSDESLSQSKASLAPLLSQEGKAGQGLTGKQREFQSLSEIGGLNDEQKAKAAMIQLGLTPRAGESALERIANDPNLAKQIALNKGAEEEEKVAGKAKGEAKTANIVAKTKSLIAESVTLATKAAKERGETLTDLAKAKASMPALQEVVGSLRSLAPIATHTTGGRAFDLASRELGFGATKGATARARYGAMINNQILPLLKQTFGAAFTVAEKDELKSTMGDLDLSPEEKTAVLDEFISAKFRTIESSQRELGVDEPPVGASQLGQGSGLKPVGEMTDEEMMRELGL